MISSPIRAMTKDDLRLPDRPFRHIFLVQNRDFWSTCPFTYDKEQDLVLTFDFAVVREVSLQGGTVAYLDHMVKSDLIERYNHETYRFFATWYLDKNGQDIFSYRGMKISTALRLYIWTDITYIVHLLVNLLALKHVRHERIFVGTEDALVLDALGLLGLRVESWQTAAGKQLREYYFPIFRWMHEQIYPSPMKRLVKIMVSRMLSAVTNLGSRLGILKNGTQNVFVQPYYPTYGIIKQLNRDENVNVVLENPADICGITREKYIPLSWTSARYRVLAESMINSFRSQKNTQWYIEGIDIGEYLYITILKRAATVLPECLNRMDDILDFFSKRPLKLMITTTNIGLTNCLMLNYCHARNIPTYLIINGYLGNAYLDESKDARWINSYGPSIKEHYFAGMENIVCLGDPRMDAYARADNSRQISTDKPTIVIGAAGYNNIDLNSYVAYEFDFLNDVLTACRTLISQGRSMDLIVKVRANGYIDQYRDFLREYHADIPVTLHDQVPMQQLLARADCYISLYSGTLFEAACLGIPALYYKKDTEIMAPPFDGASELVTADTPDELARKLELFYDHDSIFDAFRERNVLEKYVGPLDGNNLERNLKFIYSLLNVIPQKKKEELHS
jgi:hypothetical protein